MNLRRDSLYGRRKGKPLSPRRARLVESELPRLGIDISVPAPTHLGDLLPNAPSDMRLEIGFGGGEHLVARATAAPHVGFIGVEPFESGMAKAVAAVSDGGIGNVRFYAGDATHLLDWLPAASLSAVDLLYPDPWPKKRHWKRRFVSAANLDRLARVLRSGGDFRFASDIPDYVEWTLVLVQKRTDFVWTATWASDWTRPFAGWPGTRYEAKALQAGRTPTYLAFKRV